MLLIDNDLLVIRCSECKTVIDIPLRDRATHSRLAFRDRMAITHRCGKTAAPEQTTAAKQPNTKTWAELIAPYAAELAQLTH